MRTFLLALAILFIAPPVFAEPETHDGFLFRVRVGPGKLLIDGRKGNETLVIDENAVEAHFTFGGRIAENIILYGKTGLSQVQKPKITVNDQEFVTSETLGYFSIGVGANYYVMPLNLYFGGTLSLSQLKVSVKDDGRMRDLGESEFGSSLELIVGKEWWVSDDWGLGIAMSANVGRIKDKIRNSNHTVNWEITTVMLGFSATYN